MYVNFLAYYLYMKIYSLATKLAQSFHISPLKPMHRTNFIKNRLNFAPLFIKTLF